MDASRVTDGEQVEAVEQPASTDSGPVVIRLDGINTHNINHLAAFLTENLCTNIHGNFYIKGSGFGSEGRQVQLREVVELRDALLEVIAIVNGKSGVAAVEAMKETKNAGKSKGALMEAINKKFEDLLEGPIRDITTNAKGLESELQKANEEVKRLAADNVELERKVQTLETGMKNSKKDMNKAVKNAVEESIDVKNIDTKIDLATNPLDRQITRGLSNVENDISMLKRDVRKLDGSTNGLEEKLDRVDSTVQRVDTKLQWLDQWVDTLRSWTWQEIYRLSGR